VIIQSLDCYLKALKDINALTSEERQVFILMEFETLMIMEGWDHFFTYDWHLKFYPELKQTLQIIDDNDSLSVLNNYEQHLYEKGVPIEAKAIENFVFSQELSYFRNSPDWTKLYNEFAEERWNKMSKYLAKKGIILQT
jgi:hypothetical protein